MRRGNSAFSKFIKLLFASRGDHISYYIDRQFARAQSRQLSQTYPRVQARYGNFLLILWADWESVIVPSVFLSRRYSVGRIAFLFVFYVCNFMCLSFYNSWWWIFCHQGACCCVIPTFIASLIYLVLALFMPYANITKKYCKTIDETGSDDVFRKHTCTLPVDRIDLSSLVDGKNDKYVKVPGNGRQSGTDRKNAMQWCKHKIK